MGDDNKSRRIKTPRNLFAGVVVMKTYVLPNMTIKDGLSELIDQIKEKPKEVTPVIRKYALKIQGEAAIASPVKTGALKNSFTSKEISETMYHVMDGMTYGVFQELGTSRGVPARHMLGGACERNADAFINEVKEVLGK